MTLQKDQDPGWWRRPMSRRGQLIIIVIAVAAIAFGLTQVVLSGQRLF